MIGPVRGISAPGAAAALASNISMDPGIHEPAAKRRKIRKGTRSCWECKGRKVRCTYTSSGDTVCDGCFRRGTKCVSQELPEQPLAPVDRRRQMANRMVRVESLIERLVKRAEGGVLDANNVSDSELSQDVTPCVEGPVPGSTGAVQDRNVAPPIRPGVDATVLSANSALRSPDKRTVEKLRAPDLAKQRKISEALLAVFPSPETINTVVKMAGPMPSIFHQQVCRPYKDVYIDEEEKHDQLAELTIRHSYETHPLVIVRQMLLLAISFQNIHPSSHHDLVGFSEPPANVLRRVADTAIDFVSTNDSMLDAIEGLDCLLLASSFEADSGNLRSAWSMTRRAMLKAQLMSLHRQQHPPPKSVQPGNKWDPQHLWYRIVYYDRFFSLILGLPQGSTDISMGSASSFDNDTSMGRLERRHCVLASRILQRNEREPSADDLIEAQAIDLELRKLSESMPSKWWLVPNLASMQDDAQMFWGATKLTNQIFHYILLSHLHLPFMLGSFSGPSQHDCEYNRIACINASRDLLARYMAFRTFHRGSYCCHSMDFFAITASMTLLLAHLDAHRSKRDPDKALIHQRISDRAMMEEILDNMEQVGTLNKAKTLSEKGAGVLRRLLAIEAHVAISSSSRPRTGSHPSDVRILRLRIPYFGVIIITQDGDIFQEANQYSHSGPENDSALPPKKPQTAQAAPLPHSLLEAAPANSIPSLDGTGSETNSAITAVMPEQAAHQAIHRRQAQLPTLASSEVRMAESCDLMPHIGEPATDSSLTESQGDPALQGMDMTFFDTMLEGFDTQAENIDDYWWLPYD